MFNYLFPIFCFGLVVTGVVWLGVMEARKQYSNQNKMSSENKDSERDQTKP